MFQCHRASGQVWAEVARNLADSLVIPFKIQDYANKLRDGVEELDRNLGSLMRRNGIQTGNEHHYEIKNKSHSERRTLYCCNYSAKIRSPEITPKSSPVKKKSNCS